MNRDVRDAWVAALRSGRYPQAAGKLTWVEAQPGRPGYCCLGVLCALATDAEVVLAVVDDNVVRYDDATNYLPQAVVDWAGLHASDPAVPWAGLDDVVLVRLRARHPLLLSTVLLSQLNDDANVDFATVADLIEERL